MNIIDRVKYDGPSDVFAWRWPHDSLVWGTQVIVNQTQEALFFKNGQALDLLSPGRHTLKTTNIPLLEHIVNIPFDNETPFAAEIYYVNKAVNMDMKWGTREPIPILEPAYNVFVPVRAFGQFAIKIQDSRKFITSLVGTVQEFDQQQVLDYFRGHLMTRIKDYISEKVIKDKISLLQISAYLNEFSKALEHDIKDEFERFGIEIVNFYLSSINIPQDDTSVIKLKEMLAKKAEFDLYGQDYGKVKMFDVAEQAAANEGQGVAGAGVGMGVGMGIGQQMSNMSAGLMDQQPGHKSALQNSGPACIYCAHTLPANAKFCPDCGTEQKPVAKFCSECGTEKSPDAKFCSNCGFKQ